MKWQSWVKTKFSFFLLIVISACANNKINGIDNVENIVKEQQFIELKIDSNGADYLIMFNDVKVFSELQKSPVKHTIPVNHWVKNGVNNIQVAVDYDEHEKSLELSRSVLLNISIVLRVKNGEQERSFTLTQFDLGISDEKLALVEEGGLEFSLENKEELIASKSLQNQEITLKELSSGSNEIIIKTDNWSAMDEDSWTRFKQNFTMDLGYPEWAYLTADDLGDPDAMSDDEFFGLTDNLYEEYKRIWQLMKDKNKEDLLPLFELRASEFDAAYYLPKGEKYADMDYSLTSAFEHKDLYLDDIIPNERAQLAIEADGKIAILRVAAVAEPLIYYSHVREAFTRSYTLYFMRKNGKWIIIR